MNDEEEHYADSVWPASTYPDNAVEELQEYNKSVADQLFPNRTDQSMFLKLYGEVAELIRDPGNPGEIADIIIMMMDHASRHGVDVEKAVRDKLALNLTRTWVTDPRTGVSQHVEGL